MRVIYSFLFFLSILSLHAQVTNDVYIQFFVSVLSTRDSAAVAEVNVQYEKLPYYDDMGIGKTNAEGKVEFYLIKGLTYSFTLKKEGFLPSTGEIVISDNGSGTQLSSLYIEPEPLPEVFTLKNLIFARGSAVISSTSYEGLDELAKLVNQYPTMVIQLEGHTDFDGNADANMKLSEARVESVKAYLIDKGVNKNKVFTKAFGGTQPLSVERTDEAKERNRRVEVRILHK